MKIFAFPRKLVGHPSRLGLILSAGLFSTTMILATGCHKAAQSAAPSATQAAELQPLNRALLQWILQNRRHPTNFAEFAASANIKIPSPPPGKKYILNHQGLISLANSN